jgi:serine/threonine protein kinase
LSEQGCWGKVYALEQFADNKEPQILCAVKVLLTRKDKDMAVQTFRERHRDEIKNNLIISNWDLAIKPYGILKNDEDHFILFLEYGQSGHEYFKNQPAEAFLDNLDEFLNEVNKMHALGYAHGDLKIDNMLIVNNKIKLCDWYSLTDFKKIPVQKYRYIGDNLPPEAIRAFYFGENTALNYSRVKLKNTEKAYILHPIAADRFCMSISLLEILAPELHLDLTKKYEEIFPKDFNPYQPTTLDFMPKYVQFLKETQATLLKLAKKTDDKRKQKLCKNMAKFIELDPMKR